MKMLRKITDCESFEISQENISDEVYFSKIASLQCTGSICTINTQQILFEKYSEN